MHYAPSPTRTIPAHGAHDGVPGFLAGLIRETGARITYAPLDPHHGDALWTAATHTLTVRADATPAARTYALAEWCRRIYIGADHSNFTATPRTRHLHAV